MPPDPYRSGGILCIQPAETFRSAAAAIAAAAAVIAATAVVAAAAAKYNDEQNDNPAAVTVEASVHKSFLL